MLVSLVLLLFVPAMSAVDFKNIFCSSCSRQLYTIGVSKLHLDPRLEILLYTWKLR